MGKAEDLLAASLTPVSPTEEDHIIIGSDRQIKIPSSLQRLAVQYDHRVEAVTFDCPRYHDNIDLSQLHIYVNYLRSDNEAGSCLVEDVTVDEGDDTLMHFTWIIDGHVTAVSGILTLLVCAKMANDEGELENLWNSELCTTGRISSGMKTGNTIVEKYPDLVEKMLVKINNYAIFTPHMSEDGTLSWTNDGDKENPESINLTGPKGDKGDTGAQGEQGPKGDKGDTGAVDLNEIVKIFFNLSRTGKVYTVKFPLWETSRTSTGEKLDDNTALTALPSTATEYRQNDYDDIPLFRTYDCNAHVTSDGVRIIDALKGQDGFQDTGEVDVFVVGMSYYEKYWLDDGYWYYSITDLPKEGYSLAIECKKKDGTDQGFCVYSKYIAGKINGKLYSSKGLAPARYIDGAPSGISTSISYSNTIRLFKARGEYYSGGMLCDYKYMLTRFYLMFATLNTQSIMAGCSKYNCLYTSNIVEGDTNRVILTTDQANNIQIGSCISIGTNTSSTDRVLWVCHNIADSVLVTGKEKYDDTHTAILTNTTFTISSSIGVRSMYWRSGFSDRVKGRTGCPCDTVDELTNGMFPISLNGIEIMVGGYEIGGNAIADVIDSAGTRNIYMTNDAKKLDSNIDTIRTNYTLSGNQIKITKLSNWNYITAMSIDILNGVMTGTEAGGENSGSGSGYADGLYVDAGTTGPRELLFFGYLGLGACGGLSCLSAYYALSDTRWYLLSRLSINGIGVN